MADATSALRQTQATRVARQADESSDTAHALRTLVEVINTDPRFTVLRNGPTPDTLLRDADDFEDDAEDCRFRALRLGYVPE